MEPLKSSRRLSSSPVKRGVDGGDQIALGEIAQRRSRADSTAKRSWASAAAFSVSDLWRWVSASSRARVLSLSTRILSSAFILKTSSARAISPISSARAAVGDIDIEIAGGNIAHGADQPAGSGP
jgi:hypothetical protein